MGTKPSAIQTKQLANLSKSLLNQLTFPQVSQRFQKAEFYYKTKQMKIHIPVDNTNFIKQWESNIKILHQDEMKGYILLPKSYEFEKQGYCGSAGIAKILYDYFPYSLEGEIENRKKSIDNQQFSEQQLWKIMFTLLKAAQLMHLNWKKIGDIRPKNIFYNQQKQVRVSCQFSYPRELTNYQKFVFEKQPTYLSPQELQDIKMGRIDPDKSRKAKQHIIQAESWSIGLTLLHVALLFNCEKLYSPLKCEMNFDLLKQKIVDLENKKNLSVAFKNVVKSMVEDIPQRRLLCSELLTNFLEPFKDNIIKMQKFDISQLNSDIKDLMEKKTVNSLIGTIWKSCNAGLIESIVVHNIKPQRSLAERQAKQTLFEELQKFSQIPPKNSQVSMRESIKLGGSIKKITESNAVRRQSQVSNQSFYTVGSLRKETNQFNNLNRISNFSLQNRFGAPNRIITSGDHMSPLKTHNFDNISQKFMTPLQQSSYFQTIHANERSFDFYQFNSTFRNSQASQAVQDNFLKKIDEKIKQSQANVPIQGNFKKEKSKEKY